MNNRKKKKKVYSKQDMRPYEVRDYFARKMVSNGLTVEQFNKLVGVKKK